MFLIILIPFYVWFGLLIIKVIVELLGGGRE